MVLWALAVTVTLVLTFGIVSLTFLSVASPDRVDLWSDLKGMGRGLASLYVFNIYTLYQRLQLQRTRQRLAEQISSSQSSQKMPPT